MKEIVETFVGKFDRLISDEQREYLLFLYRTLHLGELSEKEQHFFVNYFFNSETLQNMAAFAIALDDVIHEIEENIPAIEKEERLANGEEQRLYYERKRQDERLHQLKHRITKKDNIFYVPFADYKKELGPIIICLEQTTGMAGYSEVCKSMILPLFMTAHHEHRDLYIIPYNHQVKVHYRFENGHLNLPDFTEFIESTADGDAAIMPVLQFAKGLLQENHPCDEAEIIIFTEGAPSDGEKLVTPNMKMLIQEITDQYHTEISVVVMHEEKFKKQYFWFANKAFFADDTFQ